MLGLEIEKVSLQETYMNTPLFAKHPIHDSAKVKIAPVHSDFGVATPRSRMGFSGRASIGIAHSKCSVSCDDPSTMKKFKAALVKVKKANNFAELLAFYSVRNAFLVYLNRNFSPRFFVIEY